MNLECEHCGAKVWLADYNEHLAVDHDIDVPSWGRPCHECEGTGDAIRRHWEADGGICHTCHGKGIL